MLIKVYLQEVHLEQNRMGSFLYLFH